MFIFPGLSTNLSQLDGLILLDKSASATVISHFPTTELPLDVKSRFETLFGVQDRWTYDEIRPFLEYVEFLYFSVFCIFYDIKNILYIIISLLYCQWLYIWFLISYSDILIFFCSFFSIQVI